MKLTSNEVESLLLELWKCVAEASDAGIGLRWGTGVPDDNHPVARMRDLLAPFAVQLLPQVEDVNDIDITDGIDSVDYIRGLRDEWDCSDELDQ